MEKISPIVFAIPFFFLLIAIEYFIGKRKKKTVYRLTDAVTNINCGIGDQTSKIFVKSSYLLVFGFIYQHLSIFTLPNVWWVWILLLLIFDFCFYWAHRISHEVNVFWGGHVVHHQSEDYNLSVALRQPWFTSVLTMFLFFPIPILGFPIQAFAAIAAIDSLYQFWIHTQLIKKMPKWFEYIMNTPSHHRVHHGRNPEYIDKNYAGVFIIWDRMFGTFKQEEQEVIYGITKAYTSWDPVWANFDYWKTMWLEMKKIPMLKDKIKYLFGPPGWLPAELGGYQAPPEIDMQHYKKFDTLLSKKVQLYVWVQMPLLLVATTAFLYKVPDIDYWWLQLIILSVILFWTITIGAMMQKKIWGYTAEYVRISLSVAAIVFLLLYYLPFSVIVALILGVTIIAHTVCMIWLSRLSPIFSK